MAILLIYIILSFWFGRKNPFLYLLFAFALQQGPGAFIDQSLVISGKKIFSVFDTVFNDVLFFIILIISVLFIKTKIPRCKGWAVEAIIIYFIYLLMLLINDYATRNDLNEILLTSRIFFYIPLSFFLWLSIFQAVQRGQYEAFLRLLFYITPISALLYILNSSNIVPLFPRDLIYLEVEMIPTNSFRDFATMPFFIVPILVMSFQSVLMPTFKLPRYLIIINLIVLPVGLLFTFTRSLFIMVILQLVIMIALSCVSKGLNGIKRSLTFVFLFAILFLTMYSSAIHIFPNQIAYLTERFSNVANDGIKEQNTDIRILYLQKAIDITNFTSPAFGAGMNRQYYQQLNNVGAWSVDSTIPLFLYHTGWIGVGFIYFILIGFSLDSCYQYYKKGDWLVAFLASNFFTITIASLMMGGLDLTGSVWTFMDMALYTTIKFNLWKRVTLVLPKRQQSAKFQLI